MNDDRPEVTEADKAEGWFRIGFYGDPAEGLFAGLAFAGLYLLYRRARDVARWLAHPRS